MTRVLSPGSDEQWRAFDAEAQMLARALRTGRFTVLVGALGVGKTRLLVDGLLPLLSRRIGDEPRRPGVALQVVVPVPDRRSRAPGRDRGELLYFVDQRDGVPSDSPVRARAELPAGAQVHFDLAESMSPAHLSALSQQHAGAHLLFVFDHFESVLEGAQHSPDMQRFVDAWAKAVQTPDLNVHFLVALDEHVWLRLLALRANLPDVELRAFHLQTRDGRQVLESLPENQPLGGDAKTELSAADFMASINARLSEVTKSTREATSGPEDFNASLNAAMSRVFRLARPVKPSPISEPSPAKRQSIVESQGANRVRPAATVVAPAPAPQSGGAARETLATAGQGAMALEATEAEGKLVAARRAEAQRAREAEIRQRESREAAERAAADRAAEAARETQARQNAEAAAKAVAAERRVEAARRAVAERDAEAARQVEAARVGEARRLAQALAAAEAAVAREVHSRQIAEALAKAAQTERRVESERSAEAVRQAEAARWAESQKLAQALAAAEAVAAREVRARQIAEAAAKAAQAERRAEQEAVLAAAQAVARRATEARLRTQEQLVVSAAAKSAGQADYRRCSGRLAPDYRWRCRAAANGSALGHGRSCRCDWWSVLWWPTHSPPPAVSAASPTVAAAPASPEVAAPPHTSDSASSLESTSAAEPAPARSGRYEVLAAGGDGSSGRIARELAGALSTDPAAMRVAPLGAGTDPISWVQAPGRLAIVRFDALRLARGGACAAARADATVPGRGVVHRPRRFATEVHPRAQRAAPQHRTGLKEMDRRRCARSTGVCSTRR